MSHPYHHAQSSVNLFGGEINDYLDIHRWFDETKITYGCFKHRAIRHHRLGISWACQKFGHAFTNAAGNIVHVYAVAEQHIREDCGDRVPDVQDWMAQVNKGHIVSKVVTAESQAENSAKVFGGTPADYYPLHLWIDGLLPPSSSDIEPCHMALRHHAFGLFEAEKALDSVTIHNSDGIQIPIRLIGECHIKIECNNVIPSVEDWLCDIQMRPWMIDVVR